MDLINFTFPTESEPDIAIEPITIIAERIRKLPEIQNAWMRKRSQQELVIGRRHNSLAPKKQIEQQLQP